MRTTNELGYNLVAELNAVQVVVLKQVKTLQTQTHTCTGSDVDGRPYMGRVFLKPLGRLPKLCHKLS